MKESKNMQSNASEPGAGGTRWGKRETKAEVERKGETSVKAQERASITGGYKEISASSFKVSNHPMLWGVRSVMDENRKGTQSCLTVAHTQG